VNVDAYERCKIIIQEAFRNNIQLPEIKKNLAELVSFFQANTDGSLDEIKAQVFLLFQKEVEKNAGICSGALSKPSCETLHEIALNFCYAQTWDLACETYLEAVSEFQLGDAAEPTSESASLYCEYASFLLHHEGDKKIAKELFYRSRNIPKESEKCMIALVCFALEADTLEEIDDQFEAFLETHTSWKLDALKSLFELQMEEAEHSEALLRKAIHGCGTHIGEFANDLVELGFPNIAQKWLSMLTHSSLREDITSKTDKILHIVTSAKVKRHLRKLEEASELIKGAFRFGPAQKEAWLEAACIYDAQKMPEALQAFESYIAALDEHEEPNPYALYRVCTLSVQHGKCLEALELAKRRKESVFHRLQAEASLMLRDPHNALKQLSIAAKKNPRDGITWFLISQTEQDPLRKNRAKQIARNLTKCESFQQKYERFMK